MIRTLPILCAGDVVRNILSGRQTQDRRPIHALRPLDDGRPSYAQYHIREVVTADHTFRKAERGRSFLHVHAGLGENEGWWMPAPWSPGDVLYVRETWAKDACGGIIYAADNYAMTPHVGPWRPSIHMPKWAARLRLRVLSVGVERVSAISEEDAMAEGCDSIAAFAALWDRLYGAGSFDSGAWCWVTRFERVEVPRD